LARTASCQCRAFRAVTTAEPVYVGICHCTECQRRSGVPLTCNAYFLKSDVQLEGEYKTYSRDCPDGRKLHNHFCPTCGATVCWTADLRPDQYGIAIGAFNDPSFPKPSASIWEDSMYTWVTLPVDVQHFPQARPIPKSS
jgi:hypothetical protein